LKGFKQAVKDDDKDGKNDPDQLADDSDGVNISARTEKTQDK